MLLTDKMRNIATEVRAIRQSVSIADPRQGGDFQSRESFGLSRRDRIIASRDTPEYEAAFRECASLIAGVYQGSRPDWHLREGMSTSDFPNLFGDLLYRQLLGNYVPYPVTYPAYFRITDLKDFRKLHLYAIDGGQDILPEVKELEPYKETKFTETPYSVAVLKYGRRYGISYEMIVNDDLQAFQQRPQLMAVGARRSEEYLATTMLCDVNGPHAGFFTAGNKNIVTGNPALSQPALQTAFKILKAQKDAEGQPIVITAVHLVVSPNDEITAENILHALQIRIKENGGGTNTELLVENWMTAKITLSVNPYIPYVASSATANPWFLIANPNDVGQRPAFMFGFLRGRRAPQLWVRDGDAIPLSGGNPDPMEGSFDNDSIDYKLRHIFGAAQIDPKMAVSSNGTGV